MNKHTQRAHRPSVRKEIPLMTASVWREDRRRIDGLKMNVFA